MWSGKRSPNHALIVLAIAVMFLGIAFSCAGRQVHDKEIYRVKRVIDGDTIKLTNGESVRLIGVDTPETKHPYKPVEYFGEEAYRFTKRRVEGKKVRLEFDWQERDRYGRLLAYVYLMDGTFVNAEIIKQGYGHATRNIHSSFWKSSGSMNERPGKIGSGFGSKKEEFIFTDNVKLNSTLSSCNIHFTKA